MSILIIGGAGYIGSHTVKYFLGQSEDVIIVDNLLTGHKEAVLTDKFYKCDIRTPSRNRNIPGRGFRFGFHEKRSARNGPSGSRK